MTATLSQPNCWFVHAEGRTIACVVRDSLGYYFSWRVDETVALLDCVIAVRALNSRGEA